MEVMKEEKKTGREMFEREESRKRRKKRRK